MGGNASDRHLLEHLLIVNQWERARASARQYADLSQHGGHECLRNLTLDGVCMQWQSDKTSMPSRGEMIFDFCSPFHPSKDETPTCGHLLDRLVQALDKSEIDDMPKVDVMRTMLHTLILTPKQCARLLEPVGHASIASDENSPGTAKISPRVDAFCALYTRCTDIKELLSNNEPHGLYSMSLLRKQEVLNVRLRLGRLRTWDITRLEQDWLVPGKVKVEAKDRIALAELDLKQGHGMVRGFGLLDDVTSKGNANRFVLNLEVFEDWMFTRVLMQVAGRETDSWGQHFDDPSWSEIAHLEARGAKWLVPPEWSITTPDVGIFTVRYKLTEQGIPFQDIRLKTATSFLGW
jgi:hypothetical protein